MTYETHLDFISKTTGSFKDFIHAFGCGAQNYHERRCRIGKITMKAK